MPTAVEVKLYTSRSSGGAKVAAPVLSYAPAGSGGATETQIHYDLELDALAYVPLSQVNTVVPNPHVNSYCVPDRTIVCCVDDKGERGAEQPGRQPDGSASPSGRLHSPAECVRHTEHLQQGAI